MKEQEGVLIVGNGAREHAAGWKIKQFSANAQLFFAPGNPGTAKIGRNLEISSTDIEGTVRFARDNNTFVFVGPEVPLGLGIVDKAMEEGVEIFGPTEKAARLETSKWWAIEFMRRHNIPHPRSVSFTDSQSAEDFFKKNPKIWKHIVIKADELAAGKGVFLPKSKEESEQAIERIVVKKEFGDGSRVIIQEKLKGREMSFMCFTDGKTIVPLLPAQDYKRFDDEGPNTGGVGAFAPAPMSKKLYEEIYESILEPTVRGMREEENLFKGVLYAGLMLTDDGPKVIEFNVRLGDPEAQVLMMLLKSDLLRALKNTAAGRLRIKDVVFRSGASLCVVLAANGYPEKPIKGDIVYGLDKRNHSDVQVFHSGTKRLENGDMATNGGRILTVAARGKDIVDAKNKIDPLIGENGIHFKGMQYRKDIGL